MLAAEESAAPEPETSAVTKSGAGERQELKPPRATTAPAKSASSSLAAVGSTQTNAPPLAAVDKPVPPVGVTADKSAPPPAKAPSLIQRLEGREGDAMIGLAIAVVFFLTGWIGGGIHAGRRERSRRTRLRF